MRTYRYTQLFTDNLEGAHPTKGGEEITGYCPFHPDRGSRHPGFTANARTGLWYCFSCLEGGTAEEFIRRLGLPEYRAEPQYERLSTLADELRGEIRALSVADLNLPPSFTFIIGEEESVLGCRALDYLTQTRGLSIEQILSYRIGYCPKGAYKGRVVIPVWGAEGELLYWVARRFMFSGPTYKYPSAGEAGRGRNEVLFNWPEARTKNQVVICEGVFDAMAIGPHAVAILGKTASGTQQAMLRRMRASQLVIALDGDAHREAVALGRSLAGYGKDVRVAELPEGEDPASLDRAALARCIREAEPVSLRSVVLSIILGNK